MNSSISAIFDISKWRLVTWDSQGTGNPLEQYNTGQKERLHVEDGPDFQCYFTPDLRCLLTVPRPCRSYSNTRTLGIIPPIDTILVH